MTGGTVVVLGQVSGNAAAGMTGGTFWLPATEAHKVNPALVEVVAPNEADRSELYEILTDYDRATGEAASGRARALGDWLVCVRARATTGR